MDYDHVLFIVGDLIGVDSYNVSKLWDFISHTLKDGMALEVSTTKNNTLNSKNIGMFVFFSASLEEIRRVKNVDVGK